MRNLFLQSFLPVSTLLLLTACRMPVPEKGGNDTNGPAPSDTDADGGPSADGGPDRPRAPCMAQMNPTLGLLPDNSPTKGGDDETVVAVNVFSSLVCPHCAQLSETIDILWERPSWQSHVRLYFRHLAVSTAVHAATVAAFNQGEDEFWALQDEIYYQLRENGHYMSMDEVLDFAEQTLKLDMHQFEIDLESDETRARLQADRDIADALNVTGTPSVFVCDERISPSDLETIVAEYL